MNARMCVCMAGLALAASPALAQNLVNNPSFEAATVVIPPAVATDTGADGWTRFNEGAVASTDVARTGTRSMRVRFGLTPDFEGAWTGGRYNDSPNPIARRPFASLIRWKAGPVTLSAWYNIPTNAPIQGAGWTSPKLEFFNLQNPFDPNDPGDPKFLKAFEWPDTIFGTTNGQWQQFTRTLQNSDFTVTDPNNLPEPAVGANAQLRFLVIMFKPVGGNQGDTVYWDDVSVTQQLDAGGPACYPNCDGSTSNPVLTPADFVCFLNRFRAGC